jgi:hypothetical protein
MEYRYDGDGYFARIEDDRVCLGTAEEVFFRLDPVSPVDGGGQTDEEVCLSLPELLPNGGELTAVWTAQSSLWTKKEYVFRFTPEYATYCVRVYGSGTVDSVRFFLGDRRKRFYGSGYEAADYMAPAGLANAHSSGRIFTMAQDTRLGICGGFAPTPLAFSFRMADVAPRFLLGVAALPGNVSFDGVSYRSVRFAPDISRFCLCTDHAGYQQVDGCWESPAVLALTAESDLAALGRYARWHYDRGVPRARTREIPAWWNGPFFCGWKEQAVAEGYASPYDAAAQDAYLAMTETLDRRGLRPSAVIIDDKWQSAYGAALPDPDKWPDMRAFTDAQHEKGRRVVLWFKSWDCEGLPDEECIRSETGTRLAADPTAPAYRARVRQFMHTLLSQDAGCLNADGFKIDFADCIPAERNMRISEQGVYGIGLLHRLMELLYTEAKRVKPDALINTSCCHPLFAGCTDQARLHDTFFALRDSARIMHERADLFEAVMPGISVDTDAGSCGSRRDFMRYARAAVRMGVPDLYILNPIEDCALTDADWEEIRLLWEEYRQKKGVDRS